MIIHDSSCIDKHALCHQTNAKKAEGGMFNAEKVLKITKKVETCS